MPDTKYFEKEIVLSAHSQPAGVAFPAKLAYWTLGDPSHPAVLLPTCYGGSLADTLPFLYSASDRTREPILPPTRFFIIVVGLLAGGESSSPSNTPAPWNGPHFPGVTYEDNIRLQHALCTSHLGVSRLFAYIGFSMGGQQAYHMGVLFPAFAAHLVVLAGSARTSWHNWSFLEGPRYALTTADDFHGGHYTARPRRGLKAFARVYATWALSPAWFRRRAWESLGFSSLDAYLDAGWSGEDGDANDLLALLWTWQHGDVSTPFPDDHGDLATTLTRVEARALIMPSRTDQYFPPEDNEEEIRHLKNADLRCIETVWGHVAGGGHGTDEDTQFIEQEIARFLQIRR